MREVEERNGIRSVLKGPRQRSQQKQKELIKSEQTLRTCTDDTPEKPAAVAINNRKPVREIGGEDIVSEKSFRADERCLSES